MGSIIAFGASWLLAEGQWGYKFSILVRELVILGAVPAILGAFRRNKIAFFAMLAVALGGLRFFYFEKLKASFPQQEPSAEAAPIAVHQPNDPALAPDGEFLIEIREGSQLTAIRSVVDQFGLTVTPAFELADKAATDLDDYFLVNVPAGREAELSTIQAALARNEAVEWLEGNEQVTVSPIETAPMRPSPSPSKKFGINDPGLAQLWGFEAMKVDELYGILKGVKPQKQALIAILDTGVDAGHEDLKQNYVSTKAKHDSDKAMHGTHCAGIAAAVSNNGTGVASFSQTNDFVRVTSIKVLSDGGMGTQQSIINGMLEAADNGADVLSMSLGGLSSDSRQRAYQKAVEYASKKGAIVVVAAGNSNRNAREFVPANVEGVITVSAVDTLLQRASFSNFVGDVKMGVAAPGVKIYSTVPGNQYQHFNGTSMATPYVSGLVGLLKSLQPDLTTQAAFDILHKTGADTKQPSQTGKLIQPGAAVKELLKK